MHILMLTPFDYRVIIKGCHIYVPKELLRGVDEQASEWARRLAACRAQVDGDCDVCGTPFTGTRKKRYCSHNCAQKAYLQRKSSQSTPPTKASHIDSMPDEGR